MAKGTAKLNPELLGILSRLTVHAAPAGFVAKITDGQLERPTYVALNGALEALGGKWNRKLAGHLFAADPSEALDALQLTGQYQTKYSGDFFQTPQTIARDIAEWTVRRGDVVLEPSAGHGRLVQAALDAGAASVHCVEIDPKRKPQLRGEADIYDRIFMYPPCDFLTLVPKSTNLNQPYDAILMNPPFSRGAEARHILHALTFLKPGGRLASVASPGVRYRKDSIYAELRLALDVHNADIEDLPEGSFADEGTNVRTVLITLVKK